MNYNKGFENVLQKSMTATCI